MVRERSLREYFAEMFVPLNPHVGGSTAEQYRNAVNSFCEWCGGARVDSLTVENVAKFLGHLVDSGRSEKTANHRRQALLRVWRFAYENGDISTPPPYRGQLKRFREPKHAPVAWTVDEMRRLKQACDNAPSLPRFKPPVWLGCHWWALILLMWETANRLDCLLELKRAALDERGYLRVPAPTQKNRAETVHRLSAATIEAIRQLPEHQLMFPWPFRKRQIWIRYEKDVLIPAGLPVDRHHKFHCLRKTSASHMCAAEGEYAAMRHLNHGSLEVTRKYLDPTISYKQVSAADVLPEI